jgi:hypothetical protein
MCIIHAESAMNIDRDGWILDQRAAGGGSIGIKMEAD